MTQAQRFATDRLITAFQRHHAMLFAADEDLRGWARRVTSLMRLGVYPMRCNRWGCNGVGMAQPIREGVRPVYCAALTPN